MKNYDELKISTHAKERYAERIMNRENRLEINTYVQEHEEKIKTDIFKMIQYGELLFSGKPLSDLYERRAVDIYRNGLWIIIVDSARNNVVTLYSVDLGVGDEMNQMYMEKLLAQLTEAKQSLQDTKAEIEQQVATHRKTIAENEILISEYRKSIKELEQYNEHCRGIIDGLNTRSSHAERTVREVVAKLIGKKIF